MLVLALICATLVPVVVFAAENDVLADATFSQTLAKGVNYKEAKVSLNGYQQNLYYGEYKATTESDYEWVVHNKSVDGKLTLATVMEIAEDFEATTGRKVLLAVNGDYFSGGSPVESYVTNGTVRIKGAFQQKHCIGFDNNGKFVVGRMTETKYRLDVTVNDKTQSFFTDKLNTPPSENGIGIYTIPGTYTVENAGKYKINIANDYTATNPVQGTSVRMSPGTPLNNDSFAVGSSQFWVVAKGEAATYFYDNVFYGTEVTYTEMPSGNYENCTWVVGGYDILVNDGVVNTNCHTDNNGGVGAPRTFVGAKPDGTMFVCVNNGENYGKSITVNQEAQLAKDLGAQFALELDGGGSSTMIVWLNDQLVLRNNPTDGGMRRVAQAVMLVEKHANQGTDDPVDKPDDKPIDKPDNPNDNNDSQKSYKTAVIVTSSVAATGTAAAVSVVCVKFAKKRRITK